METTLVDSWWGTFRDAPVGVRTILSIREPAFRDALVEIAPGGYLGEVSASKLGRWLVRNDGATFGRFVLRRVSGGGPTVWRLDPAEREMAAA